MKKLLIIFLFNATFLFSQSDVEKKTKEFKKELTYFIDTVRTDFKSHDSTYLVFVAKIYSATSKNFCFTLGYILNSADLSFLDQNYVYYYKNQVVIMKVDSIANKKLIQKLKLKRFNNKEYIKIKSKLFPSEDGGFTYRSNGLTYCSDEKIIERTFYRNSDEIPYDKSIFGPVPSNIKIEKIK